MANARARQLRKSLTRQEVKLWLHLRGLRSDGFHFRRQVPRDGYILDFSCLRSRVIVEVDGGQHAQGMQHDRDQRRDRHFAAQGFKVLRFWNTDVDHNVEGVLQVIDEALRGLAPAPTKACTGLAGQGCARGAVATVSLP